jgi:Fe-S-cluster-containing dehydrogenase component
MSDQWVTLFDVDKCTGCCNCVLATLDEHVGNEHPGYSTAMPLHGAKLIDIDYCERGSFPAVDVAYTLRACQHCDTPPCSRAAPDAIVKRSDGIVLIDPHKARGRRDLVAACPFGAISWNDDAQVPQIWTMDAHLLDAGWTESRASQSCPTGALSTKRMSAADLRALVAEADAEPLDRTIAASPNVLYRNLARVRTVFIAGTVVERREAVQDCVAGAKVTLTAVDGVQIAECETDAFGDFRLPWHDTEQSVFLLVTDARGRSASVEHASGSNSYVGIIELA